MREYEPPQSDQLKTLPKHLLQSGNGYFSQLLFDSLRVAIIYLDQHGTICAVNRKAEEVFPQDKLLLGSSILACLSAWDEPRNCYQELLNVARTGVPIIGKVEHADLNHQHRWFKVDKVAVMDENQQVEGVLMTLDDITALKNHEAKLHQSESRYRTFVENSKDVIWRFDIDPPIPIDWPKEEIIKAILSRSRLAYCNEACAKAYHATAASLQGITLKQTGSESYEDIVKTFVEQDFCLNSQDFLWRNTKNKATHLHLSANGTVQRACLIDIWGMTRDPNERRRYIDRLEYQANHDSLTGLPNRAKLESMTKAAIESIKGDERIALIIIDLDSFKEVNDTLGHHVGDKIICDIGRRIKQVITHYHGTIARLGGDEFAILLPNIDEDDHAREVGKKILSSFRKGFKINGMNIEIRASLGISIYPDQAEDFSTLMRYADVAMYNAKQDLSIIEIYNSKKDKHSPKRLSLISDLNKAIQSNQLTLYYQPKINLLTREVIGAEALARWIHPTMGFIPPAEFVPIAEMTDTINDMTEWVLDESLHQMSKWQAKDMDIKLAVNISARNLLNHSLVDKIKHLLQQYKLHSSCLELEITESAIMNNAEYSLQVLQGINELGVELSIDDFGTGYSSLVYLKRLPVNWLKIDYAFIVNMLENVQDQIIVKSTINLAHSLGLGVVAEGVGSQEVLGCLQGMGCEQAQGFYIGKPMPAEELEVWYKNYKAN